jgi:hypothetical protein
VEDVRKQPRAESEIRNHNCRRGNSEGSASPRVPIEGQVRERDQAAVLQNARELRGRPLIAVCPGQGEQVEGGEGGKSSESGPCGRGETRAWQQPDRQPERDESPNREADLLPDDEVIATPIEGQHQGEDERHGKADGAASLEATRRFQGGGATPPSRRRGERRTSISPGCPVRASTVTYKSQ